MHGHDRKTHAVLATNNRLAKPSEVYAEADLGKLCIALQAPLHDILYCFDVMIGHPLNLRMSGTSAAGLHTRAAWPETSCLLTRRMALSTCKHKHASV